MSRAHQPHPAGVAAVVVAAMFVVPGASSAAQDQAKAKAAVAPAQNQAKAKAAAPAQHDENKPHTDMFRSVVTPKIIQVRDPRITATQVSYSDVKNETPADLQGPNGDFGKTLVLLEGDIMLGTVEEIEQANLARIEQQARQIDLDDPALKGLTRAERETLKQLQKLAPPDDAEAVAEKVRNARTLLTQAVQLGFRADQTKSKHLPGIEKATSDLVGQSREIYKKFWDGKPQAAIPVPQQAPVPHNDRAAVSVVPSDTDDPDAQVQAAVVVTIGVGGFTWPKGIIPFQFHQTFPQGQRPLVLQAIQHWNTSTQNVRFVDHTAQDTHWIVFVPAEGCATRVGMRQTPGPQAVQLAGGCLVPQIIHELGHSVGLWHEQSRNDRDSVLQIQPANINPGTQFNFDQVGPRGIGLDTFDFDSIMLYPARAFSRDGVSPTMVRINSTDQNFGIFTPGVGGRTKVLSAKDLAGVEFLYPSPAGQ